LFLTQLNNSAALLSSPSLPKVLYCSFIFYQVHR
jgi:hypothetical protein